MPKIEVYLPRRESSLAICSTDLGHTFGGDVQNDLGTLMRGKCLHKPKFAEGIVLIFSLMIYTDIVEFYFVGKTKTPFLRCFPFISKLKSGDIITTGKNLNYQTYSNFQ